MALLSIKDLHATVGETPILKGISLTVNPGEVHAIMGPNGAGKSTLSYVLAGREGYEVTKGEVSLDGKDLLDLEPDERAGEGLFIAFQYPVEIPGVTGSTFLRHALNAVRRYRGQDEIDPMGFVKMMRARIRELGMSEDLLKRSVNTGFSGGEKKRSETLQMALLEPRVAVLDETDSGLDIDALKAVSEGINRLRDPARGMIIITHYQRLLNYVAPDFVHILSDGRIVKTGGKELAQALEDGGYAAVVGDAA